jgi:hypothetical protein
VAVALVLPAALGAQVGMSNGLNYTGDIGAAGEVDLFNFTATAGEDLIVSIGETGGNTAFFPWIRLLRPDGMQIGSSFGALVGQISVAAPASGTYTVQVASADSGQNDTGSYTLTLAKSPGAFTISAGDEGGALANGENHTGTIHIGDVDMWSFSATSGDSLVVSVGETGIDTAFFPWIRLRGPSGQDLGSSFGNLVGQISVAAPATGTYTVVVGSGDSGLDATGGYTLTLAKAGSFTITDGDEGGALTNGSNHTGVIHIGDLDMWSFTATAGDDIIVSAGETGGNTPFFTWIRLRGPTGQDLGSSFGTLVGQISATAPATGTYTVIVSSGDSGLDGAGSYTLTLARSQAAFTISPGDQGGPLTNGSNHTGDIHIGDLDMWSFTASAGDSIIVSVGETGVDTALFPWIRLRGPAGQDLGSSFGGLVGQIAIAAPASGSYTVVVGTGDSGLDAEGSYTLTLAKGPGAFTISPGDQGGVMTNGVNHTGDIHIGDLDLWSFTAAAGEALTVSIGETGADSAFFPWIRLRSPTGQDLGSSFGVLAGQINANATVAGIYTVVVSSADSGLDATGTYTLTIANTPRPFTVEASDQGGPIVVGDPNPGIIHRGDVDMWTFLAHDNDPLTITITDINSPGTDFTPWIRLRSPTGAQVGSSFGATTATIVVTAPATGIYTVLVSSADSGLDGFGDYELTVSGPSTSMIRNGDFSLGEANWTFFATPTLAYIVHQVTNGVLQYYRVPPPAGTTNQAVAYQETGVSLPSGAPLLAQFDLANTSTVRKRISVLILDFDFSDLSVCSFWLEPNAPMRTYQMRTHTTQAWVNTAIYFYAATPGENGGRYEIDNVAMRYVPEQSATRTDCVDPTVAPAPGGAPGPDLLVNGNFDTGTLAPWFTFGTITSQITNGVFQFIKPSSALPTGVVAQQLAQPMAAGQILTATFRLGNSSSVRKRVTVILHDSIFSDFTACTFWLPPGQPLSTFEYRTFTSRAWADAMLSVYPATLGLAQWILLDDVTLQRTPGTSVVGTECIEPASSENVPADEAPTSFASGGARASETSRALAGGVPGAVIADEPGRPDGTRFDGQTIDLRDAATASMTFESWRPAGRSSARGLVQVSLDDVTWATLDAVPTTDEWTTVQVDLSAYAGQVVRVRFVLDLRSLAFERSDVWRIRGLRVAVR